MTSNSNKPDILFGNAPLSDLPEEGYSATRQVEDWLPRPCKMCGATFKPKKAFQLYCCTKCRMRARSVNKAPLTISPSTPNQSQTFHIHPLIVDPSLDPEAAKEVSENINIAMDGLFGETSKEAILSLFRTPEALARKAAHAEALARHEEWRRTHPEEAAELDRQRAEFEANPFNEDLYINPSSSLYQKQQARMVEWLRTHPNEPLFNPDNPHHPKHPSPPISEPLPDQKKPPLTF